MKNERGYFILEALISIVIFVVLLMSILSMISFLQRRTVKADFDSEATNLVQEGTEIARTAILADWNKYADGTYHPVLDASSGAWVLVKNEETNLEARYNRSIVLAKVCRDVTTGERIEVKSICTGEIDPNTRLITTTVSWDDNGTTKQVTANLLVLNTNLNE